MVRPASPRPRPHAAAPPTPPTPPTPPPHHPAAHASAAPHHAAMANDEGGTPASGDCEWCADVADQLLYSLSAVVAYWRTCCQSEGTDRTDCANAVRSALDVIYSKL